MVGVFEDVVEERRLAGAEEACEDRHGHLLAEGHRARRPWVILAWARVQTGYQGHTGGINKGGTSRGR